MRIACHQANFCPWLPYFYKMSMVDKFVLLHHVQFEKNGYQNRFMHKGKWITKPVNQGIEKIADKDYVGLEYGSIPGSSMPKGSVARLNELWIKAIKDTLNIKADLCDDWLYHETRPKDKTSALIDVIRSVTRGYKGEIIYVTNEEAKNKYLDEKRMRSAGIDIEYCKVPRNLQMGIFEAFEQLGIEGVIKNLPRKNEKPVPVF